MNVGGQFTSPELLTYLLNCGHQDLSTARPQGGLEALTLTERRVLNLIAEYKTSKEIAKELNISPRTVENHRANISHKLGVKGSHALIRFALEHK